MSTWTAFGSTIAMTIKQPLLYENENDNENLWELKIKTEKLKQRQECLLLYDDGERLTIAEQLGYGLECSV